VGTYSVVVTNKSGEDSAKASLKVLDRPVAPEGPMKATVEGGDVTLLWKKVKDDGGCPIETYQLEKIDNEKSSWAACGHTQDNTLTLRGLMGGLTYQFRFIQYYHYYPCHYYIIEYDNQPNICRVCAVNRIGDSDPLTSEHINIDAEDAHSRGL